jgi:HEAT repeat protein
MRLPTCGVCVVLLVAAVARAQEPEPPPRDPVALLRQALRAPVGSAARDAQLRAAADRLLSLDEQRRALLLDGWRDRDPDEHVAAADARYRQAIVERFEAGARAALRQDDLDGRVAALKMIGGFDVMCRGVGEAPLLRDFTGDLAELTRSGPTALRELAARLLGRISPEPAAAATALAELLKDPNPVLRSVAGQALGDVVTTAASLDPTQTQRTGGHAEVVRAAAAVVPVAAAGLGDTSASVRCRCAEALARAAGVLGAVVAAPVAADEVEDWETYQRAVAEEREALRPLVVALREQCGTLARGAGDGDARVRVLARHALEDVAGARVRLLRRASSAVAAPEGHGDGAAGAGSAAFLLEDPLLAGLRVALPALASGLEDPDVEVRRATVDVLEGLGRHAVPAVPALIAALSDRDRFVRWAAARALGKVRPANAEAVVAALARLLSDGDGDLRLAATAALCAYGPAARSALPALAETARSGEAEVRLAVVRVLEGIGGEDPTTLAILSGALADADGRVRQEAAQALEKLRPSAGPEGAPVKTVGHAQPR